MKDCQKEWKQKTESIIASLMGIDQLRPRPAFHEKRRVLSGSYIHKAATIGLRRGSLVSIGRSQSTKNDDLRAVNGVSGVEASMGKDDIFLDKWMSSTTDKVKEGIRIPQLSGASQSKSLSRANYHHKRSISKRGGIDAFRPKLEKAAHGFKDKKSSKSGNEEVNEFSGPESGNHRPEFASEKLAGNDTMLLRHHCIGCARNMNRISQQVLGRGKLVDISRPDHVGDKNDKDMEASHLSLNQSTLSCESKKQNFERWTRAKVVKKVGFSWRGQSLTEMLALADKGSRPGKIKDALLSGWNLKQDDSTAKEIKLKEQTISQVDILEPKGWRDDDQIQTSPDVNDAVSLSLKYTEYIQDIQDEMDNGSENDRCKEIELSQRNSKLSISNIAAQYIDDTPYDSANAFGAVVCSRINHEPQLGPSPGSLAGEGHPAYLHERFSGEGSLNEFSEDESAFSNSSNISTPMFWENQKRASQHSPDSVLEPYYAQYSSPFQCLDSAGLQLKLEALNLETEDTYSEGSVMSVSVDEDSNEQFADLSRDGRKVKRWLGDGESRNFSYLVDVLDEAGLFGMNSCMDFKKWHSVECPVNPFVFEALEKKYGKQTSWQKSERQLLFDCVNSGLTGIFDPVINFRTSIEGTLRAYLRRDEVEDELWAMLISQDKGKSKDLSGKALDKWSMAEKGMNMVCQELEAFLFDGLIVELASLWN